MPVRREIFWRLYLLRGLASRGPRQTAHHRTTGGMMALQTRKSLLILLSVVACTSSVLLLRSVPATAQSPAAVDSRAGASAHPLPFDRGSAALWQSLQKLHTRSSL